jgi:carboxypeptidase Taq
MSRERTPGRAAGASPGRRGDARRNRAAVLAAAAQLLRRRERLTMKAVADAAGVSRSIVYRHFGSAADLQHALQADTLERARVAIERSLSGGKSLLAQLRGVVEALVEVGAQTPLDVPIAAQRAAVDAVLRRLGVTPDSWRVDVAPHPFTSWLGAQDTRVTTRYEDDKELESVLAAIHEYGHGLYERQIPPELQRTSLGRGTSMSVHESQSKLWENHVGRHPAFATVIAAELGAGGHAVEPGALHAAVTRVQPSLIRVSADPLTYPLHIVLRFELEAALLEGSLEVADLSAAWRDGMRRLLGVEVPDDRSGVLQDIHWAAGSFGYFPSYALGCLIAAQLWERLEADAGPQDDALGAGDVATIRAWLAEHVHRHGRRLDTEPLVEAATGTGIDVGPFLRHVTPYARG